MLNRKIMLLAPSVVLGAMVMGAETAALPDLSRTELRENVGRQELLFQSTELVNTANTLMFSGKYREAIAEYRKVIQMLTPVGGGVVFNDRLEYCRKRIKDCYFSMAEEAMKKADELVTAYDFEEAIKVCREAMEFCPERKDELADRIEFYEKRRVRAADRESVSVDRLIPNLTAQEYQVQLLIEQGIALANRGELTQAMRKFDEVLIIDPYNEAATQNKMGIMARLREEAKSRADVTTRHMLGEIEWAAAIPIVADAPVGTPANLLDAPVDQPIPSEVEDRVRSIVIPNFAIYGGMQTFREVMEELRSLAEENDPDHHGVNFIIRDLRRNDDQENAPKLSGYSPDSKATLYDILTALQNRGDLTFKIANNAVIVAGKGVKLETMNVRRFSFAIMPGETEATLKDALSAGAGVTFSDGASLTLVPVNNEVISRNTPENQRRIAQWFGVNDNASKPMVQIMFKFLEVSQNDLDELGFNWQYARTNSNVSFTAGSNLLLRHYSNEDANDRFGGGSTGGNIEDATYNFMWNDNKNTLLASVYALDWADSSDILYSPRVTTLADTVARVNMTELHHYPGDYEDIDDESTDTYRVEVTQPQPNLDDERQLGITFEICPRVNDRLIQAKVDFNILQFDSWLIVDSRAEGGGGNNSDGGDDDDDGEYQKKAVLNNRSISTDVTLYDGKTVLIGSIAQDQVTIVNDKIPILGDIPFIGRFFQSKYEVSKKNNLLVFMTCKLVNPDGSAVYPADAVSENGLPNFPKTL